MHKQLHDLNDSNRYYSFKIVSYITDIEHVQDIFNNASHYAYIKHDKENVDSHYHILITFKSHKSIKNVLSFFPSYCNTFIDITDSTKIGGDFLYLTHRNAIDKIQYNENEVISNDIDFYNKLANNNFQTNKNIDFINDLISEDFNFKNMAIKYGRDFIKNYTTYYEFRLLLKYENEGVIHPIIESINNQSKIIQRDKLSNNNYKF